ncbi:MAG: putative ABC transporter ATP-binding protein NosF [Elusimicrobia bacterium]|nr:putative ABC transporter ATP-binding protein NosF [Elusimicrobiota bacterium]
MEVIKFENVTKIYERSHLGRVKKSTGLSRLTLAIRPGEVFGLLGLNGSGKTTAIKLLLGLLRPSSGRVDALGQIMPNMASLKKIGYLPEAAYVNKYLTGREAVRVYSKLARMPRAGREKAVDEILYKVGLSESADRPISGYSKGMMQRVSMAQALIHNPEILVMDEPVTGLDPLAIRELRQLIHWLKNQGKTVFLSSHNISEVEKVCDRIGILAAGQLVYLMEHKEWRNQEGKLESLFASTVKRTESIGPLRFVEPTDSEKEETWKA